MKRYSLKKKSIFEVPKIKDSGHGSFIADFVSIDMAVHAHWAHGRNDRLYAMKPIDLRHEGREFGPSSRREMQAVALRTFLADEFKNYSLFVDSGGDVLADRKL